MKRIVFLLFCAIFFSYGANAAIKVSPTVIEMGTKGARSNYVTSSFNVQGGENEIIRFKIYPEYFKITSKGTMDMLEKTSARDSLINNIKFVPSEFTLQNGRTQKVRLTITDFDKLPDGESRLVLFLEDVAAKEVLLPSGNKNINTKLLVKTRVGIPVYLDKGNVTKKGEIDLFKAEQQGEKLVCNMKILSDGNSKIRYFGKAQIIKGRTLIDEKPINNNVVGAKNFLLTNEILPMDKISEDGEYKIRLILNYKDENGKIKNLIKESTVNIIKTKKTTI